jgi:hypothetical protein
VSRYQHLIWLGLALARPAICQDVAVSEIVDRSMTVLRTAWDAVPGYAFVQRDETFSDSRSVSRTHQVVMIDGSDYYMPIAVNDVPLTAAERAEQIRKLAAEKARRDAETPAARQKRASDYTRQRMQNGQFIVEMPSAFRFTFERQETQHDGCRAWVLAAEPRPRSGPLSREAKVLSGMKGFLWVEQGSYRILRAEAEVTAPVSIFGFFVRVLPGTRMEFATAPGDPAMLSRFSRNITVSRLWFHSTQKTISTYWGYRPNDDVMRELLRESPY